MISRPMSNNNASCPPSACNITSRMMAIRSCNNSTLMMISPVCWWCNTVVGSSFRPMMVLENMSVLPMTALSNQPNPNRRAITTPNRANSAELAKVTTVAWRNNCQSFCGYMFRPSRNSRNMMPKSATPWIRVASATQPKTEGPNRIPSTM